MSDLPVNYVDAVLDADVNDKRRYNLINNPDGTVSFEDVTEYTQVGSDFGANDINQTNTKVNEVNANLSDLEVNPSAIYSASGDGTKTFATLLNQIKPYYMALNDDERRCTLIEYGTFVFHLSDIYSGIFTQTIVSNGEIQLNEIDLANAKYYYSSGVTANDASSLVVASGAAISLISTKDVTTSTTP